MTTLDILRAYRTPELQLEVLIELLDCGVQIERGPEGRPYELHLYKDLYIDGELIPTEQVGNRLDYIFQGGGIG